MRFICAGASRQWVLIHQELEQLADGTFRVVAKVRAKTEFPAGYIAQFRRNDYTDYEKQIAYDRLGSALNRGSRLGDDMVTPVPNDDRIGTFDTHQIDDPKLRARVEELMVAHADHGRDFLLVEQPKVGKPWPRYDELRAQGRRTIDLVVEQIVAKVREDGYTADDVLAYERQNLNRQEVLEALEELARVPEEDRVEVTA